MDRTTKSSPASVQPFLWALAAATSLTTSKYILLDLGLHYPFLVHFLHFLAVALFTVVQQCSPGLDSKIFSSPLETIPGFLIVPSSIFLLQTILHLPNVATIAMLPIVVYLSEQIATWTLRPIIHMRRSFLPTLFILFTCCGILFHEERRVSPLGILCAFAATVSLGLSLSFDQNPRLGKWYFSRLQTLSAYLLMLIISGGLVFFKEQEYLKDINRFNEHTLVLFINIASSTLAVCMGGSTLVPVSFPANQNLLLVTLCFAGLAACASVVLLQQSCYTTISQLCAYGTALACLHRLCKDRVDTHHSTFTLKTASMLLPTNEKSVCTIRDGRISKQARCKNESPPSDDASTSFPSFCRFAFAFFFPIGFTSAAWITFLILNFLPDPLSTAQQHATRLDHAYQASMSVEVVISMYSEPPSHVSSLISSLQVLPAFSNAHVHIYTKAATANITALQEQTGAHAITQLPNVGRESETYLHHILSSWDTLATHTLFVQADVHHPRHLLWRLEKYFDAQRTGMLDLGPPTENTIYSCAGSDRWGWSDSFHVVPGLFDHIYQAPCQDFLLSYKGQFLVSAQRIRGLDRSVYRDLHRALVDGNSWAHREPGLQGKADSLSEPVFGYTLERLWGLLFQCEDKAQTWQCPGGMYRERFVDSMAECQCLDR